MEELETLCNEGRRGHQARGGGSVSAMAVPVTVVQERGQMKRIILRRCDGGALHRKPSPGASFETFQLVLLRFMYDVTGCRRRRRRRT